ncbi:MAG: alpha-L-fucosidase [Armatimonadetes bacterium]|nr:alpha-L-fucosidase [Armatimonadota bacterium]
MTVFSLLLMASFIILATESSAVAPPKPLPPLPSPRQKKWQEMELTLFVHFTVNTFTDKEWGDGTEDPKIFNPSKLDVSQWVKAAKAGGFKLVILTAKHHDGFCLWPSKTTEHSVKNSPWKNGKGDLVREFVAVCRKEGVAVGLYLSPWDRHEPTYGDSPAYNAFYKKQLTELLTQYGPIDEVWFDGANGEGPNGKRQEYDWPGFYDTIRAHQPDALIAISGPDVRWVGNEEGFARETEWSVQDPHPIYHAGTKEKVWWPAECDVSIRPGWFWHPSEDEKVRTSDNLVDLYFKSVGRNSLLLLNVPPTNEGLFHGTDVQRLKEFKTKLDAIFKDDLAKGKPATASHTRGNDRRFGPAQTLDGKANTYWTTEDGITSAWLEVDLGQPTRFNVAGIQEAIELGQRVTAYRLDHWDGDEWKTFAKGTTVGRKKLDRFEPVTTQRVRLVIEDARACPAIRSFGLWNSEQAVGSRQ